MGSARGSESSGAAYPRPLRHTRRRSRVPPRLALADGGRRPQRTGRLRLARGRRGRDPAHRAGREDAGLGPDRRRPPVPGVDDLRGRARARRRPRRSPPSGRRAWRRRSTTSDCATPPTRPAARRDGDDGEAGRLRRPREHDYGYSRTGLYRRGVRALRTQVVHSAPRCATCSSSWRRHPADSPVSSSRASSLTAAATRSACRGSRTSSATAPTPRRRSEFHQTRAWRLGDEGRGVATIIEMVAMTRLDCVTGSASLMRAALAEAVNRTRYRHAFGKALVDQPLMRNVLADLAVESEAATLTSLHMAAATDAAEGTDEPRAASGASDSPCPSTGSPSAAPRRGRGAGMPRRQRVRRGVRDAPPLPRGAAELDLGGLGQRQRAGRPARPGRRSRASGRRTSTPSDARGAPTAASTPR